MEGNTNTAAWHVLYTTFRRELKVRDALRSQQTECYVPMRYDVRVVRGVKTRHYTSAISNLVFVRASLTDLKDFCATQQGTAGIMTHPDGRQHLPIVVPDKEMDNFIRLTERAENSVQYFKPGEIHLQKGDVIRIHGGVFDGCEGRVQRLRGKRNNHLVVEIKGLVVAAVELKPDMVEVKEKRSVRSNDPDGDARLLTQQALRLLTAPPSAVYNRNELNLLKSDLLHVYNRLHDVKGIIATREADIALALFLAAKAAPGSISDAGEGRLLKAAEGLKPSNLQRTRMLMYYSMLCHKDSLRTDTEQLLAQWQKKPSVRQEAILKEYEVLKKSQEKSA